MNMECGDAFPAGWKDRQAPDPGGGKSTRRGSALVELALVAPLLMLLLAGVLDFTMYLRTAACVANAARIGAQYGSLNTANALDATGMQTAALNSAPGIAGMTAVATTSCKCSDGNSVNCTGSCVSGGVTFYVQVKTQATAHTIFAYSGIGFTGTVGATAIMRAQ